MEREIRATGEKVGDYTAGQISAGARDYLEAHPELLIREAQAIRIVPEPRRLAEREHKQRATECRTSPFRNVKSCTTTRPLECRAIHCA